ncbi:MAG: DUF3560 domain-containing protein [Polyangiales bacterium]
MRTAAARRVISAEHRTRRIDARERLASIRIELRNARERRRAAIVAARIWCRTERVAARDRARMIREKAKADLAAALKRNRENAKAACIERMAAARALGSEVERARARRDAERQLIAELRNVEREHKARTKVAPSHDRPETDDEVRTQIGTLPWGLGPLFEQVKSKLKPASKETRTEALLRYAEKHPEELLAVGGHEHDRAVEQLEAVERAVAKEAGCSSYATPSTSSASSAYAAKKAARITRLRARAESKSVAAANANQAAHAIADRIPMGQPILVGHHSERRHRRDLGKIQRGFSEGLRLRDESKQLERRAARAETSTAIASDDPDAIVKLKAKFDELDKRRDLMVAANKIVRTAKSADLMGKLQALGLSAHESAKLIVPDAMGHTGFPDYAFKNAAGEAQRLKRRIADLEEDARRPKPAPVAVGDVRIEEVEHRVRIVFPSKPSEATRSALKGSGFHWSPQNGAWQRLVSQAAWLAARRIVAEANGGTPTPAPPPPPRAPSLREVGHDEGKKVKGEGLDTAKIAARIREEIKEAVKRGTLPKAKYSVRTDKYSMGSSIEVVATALPFPVLNPDAFFVRPGETFLSFDSDRFKSRLTPEAQRVERALNEIVNAYHWDKSDSSTDYYNERFARYVKVDEDADQRKLLTVTKLAAARAITGSS